LSQFLPVPCSVLFFSALAIFAAEIAAFVTVAEHIGFLYALALLIVVSALGPFIVRRVGFSVLAHTRARLAQGELPTREVLDGIVVLLAGVMICVPGFVGDALGLTLMISPVRHLIIRLAGHRLARRVERMPSRRWTVINTGFSPMAANYPPPPAEPPALPLGPGPSTSA
jgi:UPF0716 protein FxsA